MNVYDFDDTILLGDSEEKFLKYFFLHYPKTLKHFFSIVNAYFDARKNKISHEESRNIMYSFLKEFSIKEINNVLEKMWDLEIKNIKKFYYIQHRDDDVIVSATPRFILEPICKRLGIRHLIASEYDLKKHEMVGVFNFKEEKVERFKNEFKFNDIDYFYSDSETDHYLALKAKKPIKVINNKLVDWDLSKYK